MRRNDEPVDPDAIGGIGSEQTEVMADRAIHGKTIEGPDPKPKAEGEKEEPAKEEK